jgi:triosephosphate isomerase
MARIPKKNIEDINVKDKRVIVRVDFNVPLDKNTGSITDDKRIRAALPTISYLVGQQAKVILVSHLGRPKGGPDAKLSLKPVARRLAELIGRPVTLTSDVIGEDAKAKTASLRSGEILMLENVRFHREETENAPEFARELASMADLFVNDAFGTAHRAHASTAGLAGFLPAVSGYLIQKELDFMGGALDDPRRPFVAILGGAKVSDKIGVIEKLITKVDTLIIGGGMSYTFLAAQGHGVGTSLCEVDKIDLAKSLLDKAAAAGVELLLPSDTHIADKFAADAESKIVLSTSIPDDWMGLDIGPATIAKFSSVIHSAKTVVWNGPMGVFEFDKFAQGTRGIAKALAESEAVSIIGGGDSAAAVEIFGFADCVTHISTGGGASLEYLEGKILPGIDCLLDKNPRRTFAAGNWKMNNGVPDDAVGLIEALKPLVVNVEAQIALAVPFTALAAAREAAAYSNIKIAAQNCHWDDCGAYTGEVSVHMLAQMHVPYVIIGHSERREYFSETNQTVNAKVKAALNWGVRPIVCCGETLAQRRAGEAFDLVSGQIQAAFRDIPAEKADFVTIAYEPIWAIGTGKVATEEQAQEICSLIRGIIAEIYDNEIADAIRILYGGSVNAKNAAGLFAQPDIDGGLVGGASLRAEEFSVICLAGLA